MYAMNVFMIWCICKYVYTCSLEFPVNILDSCSLAENRNYIVHEVTLALYFKIITIKCLHLWRTFQYYLSVTSTQNSLKVLAITVFVQKRNCCKYYNVTGHRYFDDCRKCITKKIANHILANVDIHHWLKCFTTQPNVASVFGLWVSVPCLGFRIFEWKSHNMHISTRTLKAEIFLKHLEYRM